jgi:hypothetical protein
MFSAGGIRKVDFRNYEYPWDPPMLGAPETWTWLQEKPGTSAQLRDGKHDFSDSETPEGSYHGVHLTFSSVTYGDLNHDGKDDAAVDLLFSTDGTLHWHYLYVFTLRHGLPALIARLRSGSRADGGLVRAQIDRGSLVLDFNDPDRRLGDRCSEGYVRTRYRYQNGVFVETSKREFGDMEKPPRGRT